MQQIRKCPILLLILILPEGTFSASSNPLIVMGMIGGQVTIPCTKYKQDTSFSSSCWYLNGTAVYCSGSSMGRFVGRSQQIQTCNLLLSNLQEGDSGLFTYVWSSTHVGQVNLILTTDPALAGSPPYIEGFKGRSAMLPCINMGSGGSLPKNNCWYSKEVDIFCFSGPSPRFNQFTSRIRGRDDTNVVLPDLQVTDAGLFTCYLSSSTQGTVALKVKETAVSRPTITRNPDKPYIMAGTPITLTCLSENGSWPISYSWRRLNPHKSSYDLISSLASLSFPQAEVGDAGTYECIATNVVNGASRTEKATAQLIVQSPITNLSISVIPKQLFVFEGQLMVLRCQVDSGSEPITWTWYQLEEKGSARKAIISQEQELRLTVPAQSGQYACKAQNEYDGQNITLNSREVTVHIIPKAEVHSIATVSLCFSVFILIGLMVAGCVWMRERSTDTRTPPTKDVSAGKQTPKDKYHKSTEYKTENTSKNHYQDVEDGFYCPLSNRQMEEDVYDDLS
ncbi:platelet endothelial cell adhesion molecule [Amia ocellicauda]|uniref:platelet endothelial cell adhesion molecule n=1 Tax=Amia ocellicauda TaxID=2972642 RepID=UPI0034643785